MYKFISFIVKSIIFLFILAHLLLYAWYRYELHGVDLSIFTQETNNYKSDYYAVLWAKNKTYKKSVYEKGMRMKPIYPIFYDALMYALEINRTYYSYPSEYHPSYKIGYLVSKSYLNYKESRTKKWMTQIWISHHLTFEETVNLYLDKAYYGHNYYGLKEASRGYFGKEPNELNIYQIMMLVALTENPQLEPSRHPNKLTIKIISLMIHLHKTFPEYYSEISSLKEVLSSHIIALTVENTLKN